MLAVFHTSWSDGSDRAGVGRFHLAGASSGALMAALTACGVDLEHAKSSALDMSARWDRAQQGSWLAGVEGG